MNEREQAEYEAMRSLVEHPGWKVLMRYTQDTLDSFRQGFPFNVKDERELYFTRGVVATLTDLVNTETKLDSIAEEDFEGEDEE